MKRLSGVGLFVVAALVVGCGSGGNGNADATTTGTDAKTGTGGDGGGSKDSGALVDGGGGGDAHQGGGDGSTGGSDGSATVAADMSGGSAGADMTITVVQDAAVAAQDLIAASADLTPLDPLAAFVQQLEQASCALLSTCNSYAPYLCMSSISSTGPYNDFFLAVSSGRVKFVSANAQACLDAVTPLSCSSVSQVMGEPAACRATLVGQVQKGGACYTAIDCAAGNCDTSMACPGTCVDFLATGAACTVSDSCDSGKGESCLDGKCAVPGAAGADCVAVSDCAAGLTCINMKCATPVGAGANCINSDDCAPGNYCLIVQSTQTATCTPQVAANGTCAEDADHYSSVISGGVGECAQGTVCAGASQNQATGAVTPGKCLKPSDEGGACTPPVDFGITGCLLGLVCPAGVCKRPPTSGPCSSDPSFRCQLGAAYCDAATNTCLPQVGPGQACTTQEQCTTGVCNNGVCAGGSDESCPEK